MSQPPGSLPPGSPPAATTQTHAVAAAPLGLTGRQLAPDLARGAMLLFIAIANAPWYLWGAETRMLSQHPADGSALDRVVQTLSLVFIDARSYPMFAFLFGYGIWQIYRRQAARGVPQVDAKRALRRRQWWLLLFGLAHAALLWAGDVIGAYALIGLVVVWLFLDRKDRTLAVWAGALAALLAVLALVSFAAGLALNAAGGDLAAVGGGNAADFVDDGIGQSSYLASVLSRIGTWLFLLPVQGFLSLTMPAAVLLGILAARRGLLDEPERHRKQLRRIAVAGLGLGWLGGLVTAGQNLGWWGLAPDVDWAFTMLHTLTGLAGGLGYIALFTLVAARIERRRAARAAQPADAAQPASAAQSASSAGDGPITSALAATGKRSLTSYLAQSVLFAPFLCAWGLGLGADLSSWSVTLYAIGVWLVTVLLAVVLERRSSRGPAETLLRRLAYGPGGRSS
ncbi:DUF418 domain-containing protein [Salana multivorans]